jgi:Protein of unknown function/Domain of unknown function (DUF1835)
MTPSVLHIVFTPSGADSLRQALKNAGRDDEVISFFDDLSLGPINPPDSSLRSKWVENELGRTEWDDITAESERFWSEALSLEYRKVAWLSRRSAMEYAGFLEWVWRLGDVACELVDLTEVTISRPPQHGPALPPAPAPCVGLLSPDTIGKNDLWDLAEPLQMAVRDRYRDLWRQLRKENAPLRVLAGDTFVSAPISFFDSLLMSHVTDDWRKVAKIVGLVLAAQMDKRIFQTGDIFLAARINALAESSRLEIRGKSALEMHFSEVRLPKSPG